MQKKLIPLLVGPLVALIIYFTPAPSGLPPLAWLMLGLTLWMVIWWISEVVPIAATALLPIPMLPLLEILPLSKVTASYGHKFIFLFLGGFLIAGAMQRWGLHKRTALTVITKFGTSPGAIIAGFMVATAFLSMWISNTASTIMMFAVAVSLIEFLGEQTTDKKNMRRFAISLLLGIAYSASIGGVGTLIGTAPNAFIAGYLSDIHKTEISFLTWMQIGIPVIILMLPCAWVLLTKILFPVSELKLKNADQVISGELQKLGPMNYGERVVLTVFTATAFFWIFGKQISQFTGLTITDTGVAIAASIVLFAWPVSLAKKDFILTAKELQNVPWGILILLGGGIALAAGLKQSGLAEWIGTTVSTFGVTQWGLVALGCIMIVYLTELTSNTASTATFVPVFGAVAVGAGLDPVLSTIPIAIGASMAFMMPVATPPNAIVFAYPDLTIRDMIRTGFWLNIIAVLVCFSVIFLLAELVLGK